MGMKNKLEKQILEKKTQLQKSLENENLETLKKGREKLLLTEEEKIQN